MTWIATRFNHCIYKNEIEQAIALGIVAGFGDQTLSVEVLSKFGISEVWVLFVAAAIV